MRRDGLIPGFCLVVGYGMAKCHDCETRKMCDVIKLHPDYCPDGIAQYVTLCMECSKTRGADMKKLWKR